MVLIHFYLTFDSMCSYIVAFIILSICRSTYCGARFLHEHKNNENIGKGHQNNN